MSWGLGGALASDKQNGIKQGNGGHSPPIQGMRERKRSTVAQSDTKPKVQSNSKSTSRWKSEKQSAMRILIKLGGSRCDGGSGLFGRLGVLDLRDVVIIVV